MRNRVLAVLVAAVLVIGAVIVRYGSSGDSDSSRSGGRSVSLPTAVCAPEVAIVCSETRFSSVTIEDPGVTVARLGSDGSGSLTADVWVTTDPWPELGGVAPQRVIGLAQTSPAMVGRKDRVDAMTRFCGGSLTWKCVGGLAGSTNRDPNLPGRFTVGIDSGNSSTGLWSIAALTTGALGNERFSLNDLDLDDRFATLLTNLGQGQPSRGSGGSGPILDRFLNVPATASIVTALVPLAKNATAQTASPEEFPVITPVESPIVRAVLMRQRTNGPEIDTDAISRELTRAGWNSVTKPDPQATSAGALAAAAQRWDQVNR